MSDESLPQAVRDALHRMARASIEHGLKAGAPLIPSVAGMPEVLRAPGASFVTLTMGAGDLRGCIGRLSASRPLAEDVADNAFGAGFRDPRFPPLTAADWSACTVKLSVLGPARPMAVDGRQSVLDALEPGVDGLILSDGRRRSTFLPAVWRSLPDPADFVGHLERKGGWPPGPWSADMRAWRYRVIEF